MFGLLPNFVHEYFRNQLRVAEFGYRCTAMVPWCVREDNVRGSGQILSKKYCQVEEHENCHFKGVTATKSLRNTTKHVKLARLDLPFPSRVEVTVVEIF